MRACRGRHIGLADQDDIWYPHKLARGLERLRESGASLVYSDARLVDVDGNDLGRGLRETLELVYVRGQPHAAFYLFNCVTGCTTLFERALLDRALPIPAGVVMHDWWLAWVATLANGIDFVDEPRDDVATGLAAPAFRVLLAGGGADTGDDAGIVPEETLIADDDDTGNVRRVSLVAPDFFEFVLGVHPHGDAVLGIAGEAAGPAVPFVFQNHAFPV